MVQSATTYTLGDRVVHLFGSAAAMARRAHPLLVIGVAAGLGYLATPLLLGPVSVLSDAIHGGTTELPRGDRLTSGDGGADAAPSAPLPALAPATPTPAASTSPTASWAGWLPPRPSAPLPKLVMRVRPYYAQNPQQWRPAQRQPRAAQVPAYRQGGRPFYTPNRDIFGNRPCCIRRFDSSFNRFGGMGRSFGGGLRGGGGRR